MKSWQQWAYLRSAMLALATVLVPALVDAAEVKLSSAWMRAAAAGAPNAMAYVDLVSDVPVELIGAATPIARTVEIVFIDNQNSNEAPKIVTALPLPAHAMVRLAYLGSHLRLVDVTKTINPGDKVPLTLSFRIEGGQVFRQTVDMEVRGIVSPPAASANEPRSYRLPPPPTDGPNQVPVPPPTK